MLRQAILGVSSLITSSQLINVDFADLRSVMVNAGQGFVTIGRASGAGRARAAAAAALSSPLLEVRPHNVRGLVYAISGPEDMSLHEVNQCAEEMARVGHPDAQLIFGAGVRRRGDPEYAEDEIVVTAVITGASPPPPPPLNLFGFGSPRRRGAAPGGAEGGRVGDEE